MPAPLAVRIARRLFVCLALSVGPAALPVLAQASCAEAARLAALHSAYDDMIEGAGTPRADIGRYVVTRDLAGGDADLVARDLANAGFFEEIERLVPALNGMAALSTQTDPPADPSLHRAHRDAIANALRATGCFLDPAEQPDDADAPDRARESARDETRSDATAELGTLGPLARLLSFATQNAPQTLAGSALLLGIAGLSARWLRRRMVRAKARRYPRYGLRKPLMLTLITGNRQPMIVVDISRGGLMLTRAPGLSARDLEVAAVSLEGTNVSMSPVWENDLFIGMAFHQPISEDLLQRTLDLGGASESLPQHLPESA